MAAFGVHFGSTSACLAVFRDGKTDVVANDLGDRTTPCIVAYTDHDVAVGTAAKQGSIRNAQNTISGVKTILGRKWDDPVVQEYIKTSNVKTENKDGELVFDLEFKGQRTKVNSREIAVAIYTRMLETARSHGDGDIHDSVLAVPTEFPHEQRLVFRECAVAAGFNVLRIVNEPVAAVMAYNLGQTDNSLQCNVLVFRIGGDSSDASIVQTQNGLYRIQGTVTSTELGGSRFTNELANYLAQEFYRQYKLDVKESRRSVNKLRMATATCKHTLSTLGNASCSIDSLHEGVDFHSQVSRARFESLCSTLVQNCISLIEDVFASSSLTKNDIHKIILCGGGCKVPLIQKTIGDYIPTAELLSSIPTDEVIAMGAAKQAAILTGNKESEILANTKENEIECVAKTVCIKGNSESKGSRLYPIFTSYTPVPSRKTETFKLLEEQTSLQMDICECEDLSNPDKAQELATLVMHDLPAAAKVSVSFHLKREGSLHVTCHEETTDKTESLTIDVCS